MKNQDKSKTRNLGRKNILDDLAKNLNQLEEGLEFFDRDIPSLLGEKIDLLCLDKNHRLALVQLNHRKLKKEDSFSFFKEIFYLWNWVSNFKDDFFAEVEKKTGSPLLKIPPRIIILTSDQNQVFLEFSSHLKKLVLDVDVLHYDSTQAVKDTDLSLRLEKISLDKTNLLDQDDIDELNEDTAKRAKAQYYVWEKVRSFNPNPRGYSLNRKLMPSFKETTGKSSPKKKSEEGKT